MLALPAALLTLALASPSSAAPDASETAFFAALRAIPPVRAPRPAPRPAPAAPAPDRAASGLDFGGVTWPAELNDADRAALQTALNISGSFEGDEGWANLSDNFDGQGLSMGLLNQCLGQGSLQPLLIRMRDEKPAALSALVSPDHLKSLLAMLQAWQNAGKSAGEPLVRSLLDGPTDDSAPDLSPANRDSVAWAVKTLYAGKDFDPVWKAELNALGKSPEYVSLQIAAALGLHRSAVAAEARTGVRELRSYLFLFDVEVQNGGVYPDDWDDYAAYVRAHPKAAGTERLLKLLDLRVRHVRKKYQADVRARKGAIIRGIGKVHGETRRLPAEYAYDPAWPYR